MRSVTRALLSTLLLAVACGGDSSTPDAGTIEPPSTEHCAYAPMPATANAGGTVTPAALEAGAAEQMLRVPVGAALAAFTARADFMGSVMTVDRRYGEIAGSFAPSVGVETFPRVRALALTSGVETIVILQADLALADDAITHTVADRLGPAYAGKVIFAASHSHSAWGHYMSSSPLQIGFGRRRDLVTTRLVDDFVAVAEDALAAREPARIGFHHDGAFDPDNRVSRDRRPENDDLPNGAARKDHDLFVVRVDAMDGRPIAVLPIFGVHGTVLDADNPLATTDAPGAIARAIEETFDSEVVVMHLQGAGGDVSPAGSGGIACSGDAPCYDFARSETVGIYARDAIIAAWEAAGATATDSIALEMVTRSVPLGPDWRTFTVRDGALEYAPFDRERVPDGEIFAADGTVISPIDEFGAPVGAGLCGEGSLAIFPMAQLVGTEGLVPYQSCMVLDVVTDTLGAVMDLPFEPMPACALTRTTLSAARIGDFLFVTVPGEPVTLLADFLRSQSPVPAERTVVVGYAQGSVGYVLTPEDWLRGGYEPSINGWGPLEGQYVAERAVEMMMLATTDMREDAAAGGTDRYAPEPRGNELPPADAAPLAGTVPSAVPPLVYVRGGVTPASAEPPAMVPRLTSARYVWIGEDPIAGTPLVTLEREMTAGAGDFAQVTRRSGRPVEDGDLLLTHTPDPLERAGTAPRTHYWAVEWQVVTPFGAAGMDALDERAGAPLGRYRFRVHGTGYMLESDPFEVVAGALDVTITRSGASIALGAGYLATDGWRLLDLDLPSNERVPLRGGTVTVTLVLADASEREIADVTVAMDGTATVDAGADAAMVVRVRATDRFGNVGEATVE